MSTTPQPLDWCERLSALADGELAPDELAACLAAAETEPRARAEWDAYHVVGAVLRGEHDTAGASPGFVAALSARLEAERSAWPVYAESAQPLAEIVSTSSVANDSAFRWKLVAGLASVAAVAAIGWNVMGASGAPSGSQLASAPRSVQTAESETQAMIRDPRLDELLAAHKQAGGATALQMPSGFLRNATFDGADR